MITTSRLRRIADLALPIVAGAVATNLMTFIDTLMVGQLGDAALGGVGVGGQLFFLFLAAGLGLAAGVQAMVARRVGEGRTKETGQVLNAGIVLACLIGLVLIVLAYSLMPWLFGLLIAETAVVTQGVDYLITRIPSLLLIAVNVAFRAYWIGVSLAKWSMVSIVTLSLANVLFNYLLIFGHFGAPRLEVAGAGLGSTLAVFVGLLVNIGLALKFARANGFVQKRPDWPQCLAILKVSYPESLRQALFTVGVVVMYVLIGQIGVQELAAFHVIISICLIAYMPHIGLGGAATTLVGESLGQTDVREAKNWGWQVSNVSLFVLGVFGLLVVLFPEPLLALFFADQSTLALAVLPLQIAVCAHVLDGYSKVVGSALIGAGATPSALRLTLIPQWGLLLPLLAACVFMGYGLTPAMVIFGLVTAITGLASAYVWHRERWSGIAL
ncbi:MAG: MATE family efflux transporter [Pseudomonadota bacterium]